VVERHEFKSMHKLKKTDKSCLIHLSTSCLFFFFTCGFVLFPVICFCAFLAKSQLHLTLQKLFFAASSGAVHAGICAKRALSVSADGISIFP
jgi:hypothetical protein